MVSPWRSVLSQNSSATSTLRSKIPSRIRVTTQVQIHKNAWFFWNIPYTYIIHSWQMYDWILLCIMKRYQKWAESQNQQYSSAFTLQAKNTTNKEVEVNSFLCCTSSRSRCKYLAMRRSSILLSPCFCLRLVMLLYASHRIMDGYNVNTDLSKWWLCFWPLALKPCE